MEVCGLPPHFSSWIGYSADGVQRLDIQHKALKAMQGGKNYLASIDQALKPVEGVEKRVLDVGTGESAICLQRPRPTER